MMLKILLNHFVRDISGTPRAVTSCPKVPPPISLLQMRKLLLQPARRTTFEPLDQIRQRQFRSVFNVHMNMVFAHNAFENSDIFRIANLNQQVAASNFDVALQNVVTVLCDSHNIRGQSCRRLRRLSVFFHQPNFRLKFSGSY